MGPRSVLSSRPASAVALYVYERATVELTVTEVLRLSRLAHSPTDGFVLERYGELLPPGTVELRLDVGVYHFKSARDVRLRIGGSGAVRVVTPRGPLADAPTSTVAADG